MAGVMKSTWFALIVVAAIAMAAAPTGEAAITCGTVAQDISPCRAYLTDSGALGGCCGGVKKLLSAAATAADRKTACTCLKAIAADTPKLNTAKAAGLPGTCGVSVPFPISPSTDCSKVQ